MIKLKRYEVTFLGVLLMTSLSSASQKSELPSQHFRDEHVAIKKQLEQVGTWVDELEKEKDDKERRVQKDRIVRFFSEKIKPHAEWEERVLYPAVDTRVSKGAPPFTANDVDGTVQKGNPES